MLIGARFVSPFLLITKLPRIPFVTLVLNRFAVTDAREPSEAPIAVRATSRAWAPYSEYGFGSRPMTLPQPLMNAWPCAFFTLLFGWPAIEMNMPSEACPAC